MAEDLNIGKVPVDSCAVFMCDLQDKFRPAMLHFTEVIANSKKLVDSTKILGVPLIVTEQYPKGLGSTVSEIDIKHAIGVVPKTKFSMIIPEVETLMKSTCNGQLKCAILFGVEAHVCVEQTAMDLISRGIRVHIVADATTSRSQEDRMLAFERLRQIGCFVTTSENVIYKLLGDKDHPRFNEVRPMIKDTTLETGLVSKMSDLGLEKMSLRIKVELVHTVLTKLASNGSIGNKQLIADVVEELMSLKSQHCPVNPKGTAPINKPSSSDRDGKSMSREKKCQTCGMEFTRPQDLRRHISTQHQSVSRFLCDECGKNYRSRDGLNYHKELTHPSGSNHPEVVSSQCNLCDKFFPSQSQLKVHFKNIHQRKKSTFTCDVCNPPATFMRQDVYKSHCQTVHCQTPKPFSCPQCSKTFFSRSNLRSHSRTHDPSTAYRCETCSKKFKSRSKLEQHVQECMARKCCPSCKFTCSSSDELVQHSRLVHPMDYALQESGLLLN